MTILAVGDSFTIAGGGVTSWATIIGQRTGVPVINHAASGTGYVSQGNGTTTPQRFSRQLHFRRDLIPADVEVIVIFGSVNDRGHDLDLLCTRVFEAHMLADRLYPRAQKVVVGPQWAGPDPVPADVLAMRAPILEAMWGYDWQYPLIEPIAEGWFPRTDPSLWWTDRFHPNQAGQYRIADRLEARIRQALAA